MVDIESHTPVLYSNASYRAIHILRRKVFVWFSGLISAMKMITIVRRNAVFFLPVTIFLLSLVKEKGIVVKRFCIISENAVKIL